MRDNMFRTGKKLSAILLVTALMVSMSAMLATPSNAALPTYAALLTEAVAPTVAGTQLNTAAPIDAAGTMDADVIDDVFEDIDDLDVPLAGWGLMSLEAEDGDIVCFDKDGDTVFVPFSYAVGDRVYFLGYPPIEYYAQPNPKESADVDGHWASDNINFIAEREVFMGFPDGNFRPNAQMTRAMFATVLARMIIADLSSYNEPMFDDVDPDSWYGPSVLWAYDYGIVEGIGGGRFDPNGGITRQDMILMIERFLDVFGISLVATVDAEPFYDEDTISFWAADAVARMREHSIVQGRPGNQFDPRGFSTRAEVAAVLYRLVESAITETISRRR